MPPVPGALLPGALAPWVADIAERVQCPPDFVAVGLLVAAAAVIGLHTMDRPGHENDRAFYCEAWNGTSAYTYDRIGRAPCTFRAACLSVLALSPCVMPYTHNVSAGKVSVLLIGFVIPFALHTPAIRGEDDLFDGRHFSKIRKIEVARPPSVDSPNTQTSHLHLTNLLPLTRRGLISL